MNELRATAAIVRRHMDRRFAFDFAIQFGLVAAIAYFLGPLLQPWWTPIAIASALAAAMAAERNHAESLRRLTFFAMPLYGRQLARAHAIAPAVMSLAVPGGYTLGASLRHTPPTPAVFAAAMLAALVATLVSLSSVFRDGVRAALYVGLATILAAAVTILPLAFAREPARGLEIACALAFVAGFFALRAFGETLARYDPVPTAPAPDPALTPVARRPSRVFPTSRD